MTNTPKHRIGFRIALLVTVTSVALTFAVGTVGFVTYSRHMTDEYIRTGYSLLRIASEIVDLSDVSRYAETLETDDKYYEALARLKNVRRETGMKYLYVVIPSQDPDGSIFIFDCYDDEGWFPLGYFDPLQEGFDKWFGQYVAGERPDPVESVSEFGWDLSLYEPLKDETGKTVCFIAMDYSMEDIITARNEYLLLIIAVTLPITALGVAFTLWIMRRQIVKPIGILTRAADDYLISEINGDDISASVSQLDIKTGDELQSLSESLKSMIHKIHEHLMTLNIVTAKAETDPLTKLYNRETFSQKISFHLAERERDGYGNDGYIDAFMMIDIDYFKHVNDNYGHAAGDAVLAKCASALKLVMRDTDIIARIGGDEFAVFCKSISSPRIAERKAQQIIMSWREIIPEGGDAPVTPSIGIALSPRDGTTFQELYNNSDSALYESKENGRARFTVYAGADLPDTEVVKIEP
ncbi:MAG: diguanylate cyclase [Oscillospiraceae bacterium]|jgi:diguanylate cyclase (GGDEF)-like protein|nr:diguanylate cyclase [Oscillospiraceae bacterium]